MLTFFNNWFLVYACARIGAHEFPQFVNVNPRIKIGAQFLAALWQMTVLRDDNLICRYGSDLSTVGGDDHRVRIARNFRFQSCPDKLSLIHISEPTRLLS